MRGGKGGPGRKPGVPNAMTTDIREMIRGALEDAGGRKYLADQAADNPQAFIGLVGRIVPKEVHAIVDVTVTLDYGKRAPEGDAE